MNKYFNLGDRTFESKIKLFWALSNKIPNFFAEARNLSLSER
ncbi:MULTISPECIES: hypothetical protein [unclassified Nostoc]|nr:MULTISPECIES: hypothetical protein [unclassified Nostoc]